MRNHGIRILLNARIQGLFAAAVCCIAIPFQTLSAATYYYHNDHLGTPQVLTDKNQQVVWQGKQEPFGENSPSTSLVEQNLRFPGQYFDAETGLHYNYFRDYGPSLGRYMQSDPIGLNGGVNTYAYVKANPLIYIDLFGLAECECQAKGGGNRVNGEKICTYRCKCSSEDGCGREQTKTFNIKFSAGSSSNAICMGQNQTHYTQPGRMPAPQPFHFDTESLLEKLNPLPPSNDFMNEIEMEIAKE